MTFFSAYGHDLVKVRCPECLAPLWLPRDIRLWWPITCLECHTALEVISTDPLVVDYMTALDEADGEASDGESYDAPPA